jgi:hypothetical protein
LSLLQLPPRPAQSLRFTRLLHLSQLLRRCFSSPFSMVLLLLPPRL